MATIKNGDLTPLADVTPPTAIEKGSTSIVEERDLQTSQGNPPSETSTDNLQSSQGNPQ